MKKTISTIAMLAASALCCAACSDSSADDGGTTAPTDGSNSNTETTVQMTTAVPDAFFQTSDRRGTVEVLWYDSKDYTRPDRPSTRKPAYVYLPYGYDPSRRYDIIYLLHGWTGTAEEYFGMDSRPQLRNLMDNMIARGLTKPFIAVSPTWDKDDRSKGWDESTREAAVFPQEYVNDLIPAVESHYSTYAQSTDSAGLLASRDHRAIGGFSLGSITTWYIFEQAFAYSKWYLPMSGDNWHEGMYGGQYYPDQTASFLASVVNNSPYKNDFYVWYAVGTDDVRFAQTDNQARAMAKLTSTFNPSNFSYHQKQGGRHDMQAVWEFIYNALPSFFPPENNSNSKMKRYNRSSLITDVMSDPDFGDYGRLIFPINEGYWSGTTLEQLQLVWYNYIDPDKTVEIVNYMKEHAAAGETIFYNIYSDAERAANPELSNTGLFFFRGRQGAPFAVCNAGGGFAYVGAMHDSFPHALELSKRGYNAFALIYRPDNAYNDLARALVFIHDNAKALGVSPDGYSLWGGSAGARMAATLGNSAELHELTGRSDIPQAGAVIMQYTGYSSASQYDAPTYANCGTSDGIASWRTMQNRLQRLSDMGIPTEFHSYSGLPHGYGLGTGTVAQGWINDAISFWQRQLGTTGVSHLSPSHKLNARQRIYSTNGISRDSLQKGINIVGRRKLMKR